MAAVVIDLRHADDLRDVVHQTVQALAEGQIVAFPTETVYGLAASALDERAVERLAAVKGRKANHRARRWPSRAPKKPATTCPT